MEQGQKSWIIEGFPRTEAQAIALQKMGVIPDKFILLNQDDEHTLAAVTQNLCSDETKPGLSRVSDPEQRDRLARNAVMEYNLQI
jgi:adenylate kinase family enzyme